MSAGNKKGRGKNVNTKGLLILILLSLLIVPAVYWFISWKWAFGLLLLLPLIAFLLFIPRKFGRIFAFAYITYGIAFVSATQLQIQLAEGQKYIEFIKNHALAAFFLGGEHAFAKQALFSIVAGILLGFLIVAIPLLMVMFVSAEWVLALRRTTNVTLKTALRYLWSLIMGINYPWLIIEKGEVTESKPKGVLAELGGPGVAVIRPGHGVVFERHGQITQIAEPGLVRLKRFEQIREIVELKPMWASQNLENVLTKDRIPLRITFGVGFQIEPKFEVDKRPESHVPPDGVALTPLLSDGVYEVYEGSIRKAVFDTAADWKTVSFAFGENTLRDVIATYYFDQIFKARGEPDHADGPGRFDPDDRTIKEIEEKIAKKHKGAAVTWGVHTRGVDIKAIELPEETRSQMLEWWRTSWRRRIALIDAGMEKLSVISRGEGEAEALSVRELARAEAQTRMIMAIAHGFSHMDPGDRDSLLRLRFLEALEKIANDPATKILLPTNFSLGDFDVASLLPLSEPRLEDNHGALTSPQAGDDATSTDALDSKPRSSQ